MCPRRSLVVKYVHNKYIEYIIVAMGSVVFSLLLVQELALYVGSWGQYYFWVTSTLLYVGVCTMYL